MSTEHRIGISNTDYWLLGATKETIPGSTRVPIREIGRYLYRSDLSMDGRGVVMGDMGSGSGRSTDIIRNTFPEATLHSLDLNFSGLEATNSADLKIQASVGQLPFRDESFDVLTYCGVLTNLALPDPRESLDLRADTASEVQRCLKKGGLCVISDFARPHKLTGYPVTYSRHKLITHEKGTIAVFDKNANVSFKGLSDNEVCGLSSSPYLERFAHHYKTDELLQMFDNAGLKCERYSRESGRTPSGTPVDAIVATFIK